MKSFYPYCAHILLFILPESTNSTVAKVFLFLFRALAGAGENAPVSANPEEPDF
jgi:hypothetical protein